MTAYIQPKDLVAEETRFCIVDIDFVPNPRFSNRPEIQYTIVLMGNERLYEERLVTFFARQQDGVTPHMHNMQQAFLLKEQTPAHNCTLVQNTSSKNYTFRLEHEHASNPALCPCKNLQNMMNSVEHALQNALALDNEKKYRYTLDTLRQELRLQQHVIAVEANVKIGRVSEICRNLPSRLEDLRNVLHFLNRKREEAGYSTIPESQIDWRVREA